MKLLSQIDYFHQDIIIGNTASERQENAIVNETTSDRDSTVGTSGNNLVTNQNTVNVKTLERCFSEMIDREMSTIVDMIENRIQNAILTAIDSIVAPKSELLIRPKNASSGQDSTSVTASLKCAQHVRNTALFENASDNKNVLHTSNVNDETQNNITDEVSELSVSETRFGRQIHTHHSDRKNSKKNKSLSSLADAF